MRRLKMSSPSHYQINVSRYGKFHFSTSEHTGTFQSQEQALAMLDDFRNRFPVDDGYESTLTYWECSGRPVKNARGEQS
jgi:hypothetical protein